VPQKPRRAAKEKELKKGRPTRFPTFLMSILRRKGRGPRGQGGRKEEKDADRSETISIARKEKKKGRILAELEKRGGGGGLEYRS